MSEKSLKRLLVPFKYDKKIITKGEGRRYNGMEILHVGEFTDSIGRVPVVYSSEELSEIPNNLSMKDEYFTIEDDRIFINTDHKPDEVLSRIGYAPNIYFENGILKADGYLHCLTQQSRDVKTLIDSGYVNSLSVEIMTDDEFSHEDHKLHAKNIVLLGIAIVCFPADNQSCILS